MLTPGPNMIYLVSRSVAQGRRAGLISLTGVGAGFLIYLAAATAGMSAVFTHVPQLYLALKIAGAAYLLWLAWQAIRPGGGSPFTPRDLPADGTRKLFTMGMVTNLLNPKIAVLYVSLLPQFIDPALGSVATQSFLLGLIQIAIALTVNGMIVLFAGSVGTFFTRKPNWLRFQRYATAAALTWFAVRVATDKSKPLTA
ncbi:LysE family translocator [Alloactinosynnema sp. L-07]|uniref:LysE family translocator n=1 Tax=Alloactinosynnema sp. L-07 TaxID=1653480 RepID=UPI001E312A2C|nr:LysE family translocator [Alloactinosynnema sp. L-07]